MRILEKQLELAQSLTICEATCEQRLAAQKKAIVPPLIESLQHSEEELTIHKGRARMYQALYEQQLVRNRSGKKETILVGIGSGVGGLVLGFAGGFATGVYALR